MGNVRDKVKYPLNRQYLKNLQQFLVNHDKDPKQWDLFALWNSNISYEENKENIAAKLGIPFNRVNRMGTRKGTQDRYIQNAKQAKQENDADFCDYLVENCEQHCNNAACKVFKKVKCPGEITPCQPSRWNKNLRKKQPGSHGGCEVNEYCVNAHTRPPQHNSRTGKGIQVKKYCVDKHPRLCRRKGW